MKVWRWLRRRARKVGRLVFDDPAAERLRNTKPEPRATMTRDEFVASIPTARITYYSSPGVSRQRRAQ